MSAKKILVIGAGPGGYPAAFRARELGAEVTVVERAHPGGVCLNWGCIPSKSFLDSAHRLHGLEALKDLLQDDSATALSLLRRAASWDKIQNRRRLVVEKQRVALRKSFDAKGIKYVQGEARFLSASEAEIKTAQGTVSEKFDAAIAAAGTVPFFPPPFDPARGALLDSNSVFELPRMPASIIIVGGGVIGVEFSCFFNALGSQVTIVEMAPSLIPGEDEALSRLLKTSFEKRGIKIHLGKKAVSVDGAAGAPKRLVLEDGTALEADEIMVCAGRVAALDSLGLDKIGVAWDRRGVKVDQSFNCGPSNIYFVGDMNALSMLAHAASAQGLCAAELAMGRPGHYDNNLIPRCIYTWPEIASIGLDKKQAEAAGYSVKQHKAFLLGSGRALAQGETEGVFQLVSDTATGKLLGAQLSGIYATELLHVLAVALNSFMTVEQLKKVVFAHPTVAESLHEALSK
ncbi:MAG TPA: NAD(P)/FAD-dependent oxidoreductase [Elusimicrobiales bacterium]|nr:NAD(P)/FAD-dependent oxidoreductase [Elusimicrobiales bacterium]